MYISRTLYGTIFLLLLLALSCQRRSVAVGPNTDKQPSQATVETRPAGDLRLGAPTTDEALPGVNARPSQSLEQKNSAAAAEMVVRYRKTPCYGKCPNFTFEVRGDGRATYHGRDNVARLGRWKATLTAAEVRDLQNEAVKLGFFQLETAYPTVEARGAEDLPSSIIMVNWGSRSHEVRATYDVPATFQQYEKLLEQKIAGLAWQREVQN